ncbi:MAG: AmmeMemoRadiSam system protein B [Planctomycetota bacterium]
MMIREPVQAGCFYAASEAQCRQDLETCVAEPVPPVQGTIRGGLVPHAGWMYSGKVAGRVFAAIAAQARPTTVVLFGAVHRHRGRQAALFPSGCWATPIGPVQVDGRLAERILGHTNLIIEDAYAHEQEHSIEVQVPLIRYLLPEAMILPIMVPPTADALQVGEAVARTVEAYQIHAVMVGSTDLTHYGPSYGFTPAGVGPEGLAWAKNVNDRRMLELILGLQPQAVVAESQAHHNACGAGAIAATMAAVQQLGADQAVLLEHTTSHEVLGRRSGSDAVGYAGIVFTASLRAGRDAGS